MTPETLHDALSLGMAVREHWQRVRRQAGSDHDLGYVGFEADRIVVMDRGGRQGLTEQANSLMPNSCACRIEPIRGSSDAVNISAIPGS